MALRRLLVPLIVLPYFFALVGRVQAVEEIVEFRLQRAKCLCGVVTYPNGDPASNALVEELGPDWKGTLRSTEADSAGRFTLTPVKGRRVYYLQVSARTPGVNPLHVPVELNRFRGTKLLRLTLHFA